MKHLIRYTFFLFVISSCSKASKKNSDINNVTSLKMDSIVTLRKNNNIKIIKSNTSRHDLYLNIEKENIKKFLSIKETVSQDENLIFPKRFSNVKFISESDSIIVLLNTDSEIIFKCPKFIIGDETSITTTYIGYDSLLKYHLIQHEDIFAPFPYYDLIGTTYNDTIRLNNYPLVNYNNDLLVLRFNFYDNSTYFHLYKKENHQLEQVINCSFENWKVEHNMASPYLNKSEEFVLKYLLTDSKVETDNISKYLKIKIK
jgi:hypothetical protein